MSSLTRPTVVAAADARAAFSRRQACQGPSKKNGSRPAELEHRRRHGLQEPAVVRDQDHTGVEPRQLALEPLEALHVEVVGRLVEEQQVGVAGERARERRARQLAARERVERAVELRVAEPEPAQHGRGAVAPVPSTGVLEAGGGLAVAPQRRRRRGLRRPSPARGPAAPLRSRRGRLRQTARTRAGSARGRAAGAGRGARPARPWRTRARRPAATSRRRARAAASSCRRRSGRRARAGRRGAG